MAVYLSGPLLLGGMGYAPDHNQVYWLRALMGVSEALYLLTD